MLNFSSKKQITPSNTILERRRPSHQLRTSMGFTSRKNLTELLTSQDMEFANIKVILDKPLKTRTEKDIKIIAKILESTDLIDLIKVATEEMNLDSRFMKTTNFFASKLEYEYIESNQIIFREGDIANDFYIVLKGSVQIIKLKEFEIKLSALDYLGHLSNIDTKEQFIIKKTIEANKNAFPIHKKHYENMKDYLNLIRLRKVILSDDSKSYRDFINYIQERNVNPTKLKFVESMFFRSEDYQNELEFFKFKKILLDKINNYLEVPEYKYIQVMHEEKNVRLYEKFNFLKLEKGKCFGDFAFNQKNKKRTATVMSCENTHLGKIPSEIYEKYIKKERDKHLNREVNFFIEKFFFGKIKFETFLGKYLGNFALIEKTIGEKIYLENSEQKSIYFMKEGEVELNISASFIDLIDMIRRLNELLHGSSYKESKINYGPCVKNSNELQKVRTHRIFLYNSNQILGNEEFFFNHEKMFFNTTITSSKMKYYQLNLEKFRKMLRVESQIKNLLESNARNKMEIIINRLIELKDFTLKSIETEIMIEELNEKKKKIDNFRKNEKRMLSNFNMDPLEEKEITTYRDIFNTPTHKTNSSINSFYNSKNKSEKKLINVENQEKTKTNSETKKNLFEQKDSKTNNSVNLHKKTQLGFNLNLKNLKKVLNHKENKEIEKIRAEDATPSERLITLNSIDNIENFSIETIKIKNYSHTERTLLKSECGTNPYFNLTSLNSPKNIKIRMKKDKSKAASVNNPNEYLVNKNLALHVLETNRSIKENHRKIKNLVIKNKSSGANDYQKLFNFFPLKTFCFSESSEILPISVINESKLPKTFKSEIIKSKKKIRYEKNNVKSGLIDLLASSKFNDLPIGRNEFAKTNLFEIKKGRIITKKKKIV